MTTTKELEARLDALLAACRRLAAHAEVVAVAVRNPAAVPGDDLEDAIGGLHDLQAELADLTSDA